jgi:RNA polymerase sigma factor (sigma-70 family)
MITARNASRLLRHLQKCLAGDKAAWDKLVNRFQGWLLSFITRCLKHQKTEASVVPEIAGRVWNALWRRQGRLLHQFDPERGSFRGYLAVLARTEIRRWLRSRQRQYHREKAAARPEAQNSEATAELNQVTLDDICGTLTPREQEYFRTMFPDLFYPLACRTFSPSNAKKLRSRILKKVEVYVR